MNDEQMVERVMEHVSEAFRAGWWAAASVSARADESVDTVLREEHDTEVRPRIEAIVREGRGIGPGRVKVDEVMRSASKFVEVDKEPTP